ncbi:hypothetical protein ACFHW2_12050 [Actinomadura sp. LOL_016]|uniref:hypothetical protein n=1 Tax=unclassified Actinomadura TaxID=2626254 RepID=UPI003A80D461
MSYVPDSAMRTCDRPSCTAAYDAATGPKGQTAERHWLLHKTFGMHMCPDHSGLWRRDKSGSHCPDLDRATRTAACSCGRPLPGPTLGDMKRTYLEHLVDLDVTRTMLDKLGEARVDVTQTLPLQGAERPVREAMAELLARFKFPPPRIHKLEIGEQALAELLAVVPKEEAPRPPMSPITALAGLAGIPIVVRDDMPPRAWCLVDANGVIVHQGVWEEPDAPDHASPEEPQ